MKDALSWDQWFIDLLFRLSELTILFLLECNFRIVCQFSGPSSFWPGRGVVSCVSYGGCGHQGQGNIDNREDGAEADTHDKDMISGTIKYKQ